MNFRIHIKADTDEAVREELREIAFIITGLREATKKSRLSYKTEVIRNREKWEAMADVWIEKHKVFFK